MASSAKPSGHWRRAYDMHRLLLVIAVIYSTSVCAWALFWGIRASELAMIGGYFLVSGIFALVFFTFMYLGVFFRGLIASNAKSLSARWKAAGKGMDSWAANYFEGERFPYAVMAFLAASMANFFFICKSLVHVVYPYHVSGWDEKFVAADRFLHFGHLPHDLINPVINSLGMAHVLDITYALWLVVMYVVTGWNLMADRHIHRRMRFLWTYLLSWIVLGSICATWLSSVGPLFLHDFFPERKDVYASLIANFDSVTSQSFFFATKTRMLLLKWTHSDHVFQPNAIAAMPSMHVAVAWMIALYGREYSKWLFWAGVVFTFVVFLATVYFGIHYALDSYVSLPVVTFLWWFFGRWYDRKGIKKTQVLE